jgi:hypothetical protein
MTADGADRDETRRAASPSVGEDVLQLSHLVSAVKRAREVVALHPESARAASRVRQFVDRRGVLSKRDSLDGSRRFRETFRKRIAR